jgi:hypothetical protein
MSSFAVSFPVSFPVTYPSGRPLLNGRPATGAPGSRTLSAGPGTFTFTGQTAVLTVQRALAAAGGSFSFTGQAASLIRSTRTLVAEGGTFTFSGDSMTPIVDYKLLASGGFFSFTGQATTLTYTPVSGSIAFTPTDAQSVAPGFASGSFTVNIGTASADRIVTVGLASDNPSGNGTPVINGSISMTIAAGASDTAAQAGLWYANVPTGTSCTVSYGGGSSGISIVVGILSGQSGGGSAAHGNAVAYTAGGAQPLSVSLTVPSGGIGVAVVGANFGGGTPTFTWTGTTASAGDETTGNANAQAGMAHSTSTGSVGVSSTINLSFGGTMAAASWAA